MFVLSPEPVLLIHNILSKPIDAPPLGIFCEADYLAAVYALSRVFISVCACVIKREGKKNLKVVVLPPYTCRAPVAHGGPLTFTAPTDNRYNGVYLYFDLWSDFMAQERF